MRAWLSQKGVEPNARDFFAERFSEDELRQLIGDRPPADIFSWRSPSFRKLGVDRHSLNDEQLVSLMLEEPRLVCVSAARSSVWSFVLLQTGKDAKKMEITKKVEITSLQEEREHIEGSAR